MTGGTPVAMGGATPTTGGSSTGGASLGTGGDPGTGGAGAGTGGAEAGAGGTGSGTGGTGGGDPGGLVTGPTPVDPDTVRPELPIYYVSPDGDDTNSGTSPDAAWQTFDNIPTDSPSKVYFERGGEYPAAGEPSQGRDGPAAIDVPAGSVWAAHGEGARPLFRAVWATAGAPTGAVLSLQGDAIVEGLAFTGQAVFGVLVLTDGNVIQNCEIDGTLEDREISTGFSVRGNGNLIVGNHVRSLMPRLFDSGPPTSYGAEGIVVNGTNQEIAYNILEELWAPNETLGGVEGGCLEILARHPEEVVENVYFHHNYCERSAGFFQASASNYDFEDTREIQEHHAIVRNTVLAYNVAVDALWLYLLQPVNTDFDGVVFEHNTVIYGPDDTDVPAMNALTFGNFYDTDRIMNSSCSTEADCGNGGENRRCFSDTCYYQYLAQPGTVTVRNNLFAMLPGAPVGTMKLPPGDDDVANNIFSPEAPAGVDASLVTVVSDPGLVEGTYRIGPGSPVIDMAGEDSVEPWNDFDGKAVFCGDGPDIGAFEYCP